MSNRGMHLATLAVHAGVEIEPDQNAPITPPIVLSTVFERGSDTTFKHGLIYTLDANPNRRQLEQALAALEGGAAALAFSSGSAATLAVLQALAPGDHVVVGHGFYGTQRLLQDVMSRWQLGFTVVDSSNADEVRRAVTSKTKLIWAECPTNPLMRVTDLAALADIARTAKARFIVDNTVATPVLQRCFDLGADMVMHSATKYLGGHSDILSGALITRAEDDFFAAIGKIQKAGGAVPSPFDCWLLLRGIKTLCLRVGAQSANALKIAHALSGHPKVEKVLYAGLTSHPGHELAARQMRGGFGGLMSVLVKGGRDEAFRAIARLRLVRRATSLGGTDTTVDHRESVEPAGFGSPANLLRLSCGIEHADDLIADLSQALDAI